jgi:hypothetical protein
MDKALRWDSAAALALIKPTRLWSCAEVLTRPCPVPKSPGVYAWYFRTPPAAVPLDRCIRHDELVLLYVGISPKQPPRDGRPGSRQTLASRIRYHYRGNAEGSTLRLTLGCLLAKELGLELRRVGRGKRLTFTVEGERRLSEWMDRHAFVTWAEMSQPWLLEAKLFRELALALNLADNGHHAFCKHLMALRCLARERARALPILAK